MLITNQSEINKQGKKLEE
uniref:Uncharacterized protein n=1 Tax=Arundo donax TaxID=35708 RepID=A0A0A9FCK2_ARUDO